MPMNYFEIRKKNKHKHKKAFAFFYVSLSLFLVGSLGGVLHVFATETDTASTTEPAPLTEAEKEAQRIAQEEAEKAAQAQREADAIREKITNKNNELEQIKAKIDASQKQVQAAHGETKTLQGAVKALDSDRQKVSTDIKLTENHLETTNLNIDRLGLDIVDTENKMDTSEDAIAEVLRMAEQAESRSMVETILAKNNLSEIMDESFQLGQFRDKISNRLDELKKYKEDLLAKKTEREGEKKKLVVYKVRLVDQKVILDNTQKEKKELLAVTKNKETNYRKILEENIAKKEIFEKELFDYESQLKRELDRKFIPTIGEKILMWPLDNIRITQHFGRTKDAARLYASGTHNGIDFAATRGTPVKSAATGTVIGNGNTDITCPKSSYGKWVLIRHNNGLTTLYGHLDLIKVSNGQDVSVGDVIGYSGNTGYATGPHLHFTVFASDGVQVGSFASKACSGRKYTMPLPTAQNAYLDPEAYL
jgi:murein DD-endopeptidase MepM/ murein hydrolase activator NlpD